MIEITPGTGLALAAVADAPPLPALVTRVPELPTFQATLAVEAYPHQDGQAAGLIVIKKRIPPGRRIIPAYLRTHPASQARADRGLRLIMANRYGGHKMATMAYKILILGQPG